VTYTIVILYKVSKRKSLHCYVVEYLRWRTSDSL